MSKRLLNILLFLIGLTVGAFVLDSLAKNQYPEGILQKIQCFKEHKDDYDILFFGDSRVVYGLNPLVFDKEMEKQGLKVKSFNFALPGMGDYERSLLIERVLDLNPGRLRYLLIETTHWSTRIPEKHLFTDRGVWWHELPETLSACIGSYYMRLPLPQRLAHVQQHLAHGFLRFFHVGKGIQILKQQLFGIPEVSYQHLEPMQGHKALSVEETKNVLIKKERQEFLADPEGFEDSVIEQSKRFEHPERYSFQINEGIGRAARLQVEMIREKGIEPIYFLMPMLEPNFVDFFLARAKIIPKLIYFHDPNRYPFLFSMDCWYDRLHLNERGANRISRLLATKVGSILAGEGDQ